MTLSPESLLQTLSVPICAALVGAEWLYSHFTRKGLYSATGVLANVYLTSLNMCVDALVRGLYLFVLDYAYRFRVIELHYSPVVYWVMLIVSVDFMYYWLHRVDHRCRFFWAVHVPHHSSTEFNFSVGFRSSVFQPLYRFVYFVPLALCGFKAIDILIIYSATQLIGVLVHTQTVSRLGILEHILVTPSHHRVHHASNEKYRDKNMGMLLIVWDKLFGSFQSEDKREPVRYGLVENVAIRHPIRLVLHEWSAIAKDVSSAVSITDRLMYVFGPPGWRHDARTRTSSRT